MHAARGSAMGGLRVPPCVRHAHSGSRRCSRESWCTGFGPLPVPTGSHARTRDSHAGGERQWLTALSGRLASGAAIRLLIQSSGWVGSLSCQGTHFRKKEKKPQLQPCRRSQTSSPILSLFLLFLVCASLLLECLPSGCALSPYTYSSRVTSF